MSKIRKVQPVHLPIAPWVYINDPTSNDVLVPSLVALLPNSTRVDVAGPIVDPGKFVSMYKTAGYRNNVILFTDNKPDDQADSKKKTASALREAAIRHGCNFVSINLSYSSSTSTKAWGTNHMDLQVEPDSLSGKNLATKDLCVKIFKWLFTVLSVKESLHLIRDELMVTQFEGYEYCPINEMRNKPKDAKLHVVALILTKPEIRRGKTLTWEAVDKTGVAAFKYSHQGPASQAIWEYVLALQPGQRRVLPRMVSIEVKERLLVTVAKAPLRVTGSVIENTGTAMQRVGYGISKLGKMAQMGQRRRWVLKADFEKKVRADKKKKDEGQRKKQEEVEAKEKQKREEERKRELASKKQEKTASKVIVEKASEEWKEDDSVASTKAGSIFDEKILDGRFSC